MKKNHFQISAIVLILGIFFGNCHSKSDNSLYQTNALLVNYLNDQLSGNCAVVQKNTVSSVSTYTATGYTVPKGGCNSSTLGSSYTTTASDIVTKTDAYFDKITAILDTYSSCAVYSSIIKGSTTSSTATTPTTLNTTLASTASFIGSVKTATTATSITSAASSNTTDSANGPANCRTVKIGLLYTAGIFCSSATDSTNAQNNVKYYVVNSVSSDMYTNFEGNREILNGAKTTTDSVNFYTKSAISSMRMMTSTELTTLNSTTNQPKLDTYALTAGLYANIAGSAGLTALLGAANLATAPACLAAITAGDATTKDYLIRIPAANYTTSSSLNSNISFADKNAVTTPFIPSLTCKYGDGFTTATTTVLASSTAAVGFCPATYTKF